MKRSALVGLVGSVFLLTANCQQSGPGGGGEGGSGGTTTGAGGASGTGGTSSSGGSSGSGGSGGTSNTGGTSSSGGSSETGGSTASGGSSGDGSGGNAGAGGSSARGGSSGNGGAAGGSGGSTAAGGTTGAGGANSGGTTAKGGTTGSGGSVASGGTTTGTGGSGSGGSTSSLAATVVPDLAKGFYWEGTCGGDISVDGHNCPMTGTGSSCPGSGRNLDTTMKVGGESGKKYTVTIEVRGVAGTRCYQGGKAASTATLKEDDYNNWWYVGGSPYNATGWWNTYELHVTPSTGDPSKDVYYFNNSSNTASSGGDCEREASYLVGYTASFPVMGGGSLQFRIHDNNCKAIQNCGKVQEKTAPCSPRTVDLSKMTVQPTSPSPAASQPPKNGTWYPQWMWVVATKVDPA